MTIEISYLKAREIQREAALGEIPTLLDQYTAAIQSAPEFHESLAGAFLSTDYEVHHALLGGGVSFDRGSYTYIVTRETHGDDLQEFRFNRKRETGDTIVILGVYTPKKHPLTGAQDPRIGTKIVCYGNGAEDSFPASNDMSAVEKARKILDDFTNQT